ncbi:NAD(P)-dependent oxidoreductase [Aurantivibrio infirmus]
MSIAIGFVGLGVMGYPMAGHLQKHGHPVTVFNRSTNRAKQWVDEYGGAMATSPREVALASDVIFTCVGNDHDLRDVVLGVDGVAQGMSSGNILVDHTTVSAGIARELNNVVQQKACCFLDAPVSGGQKGAENASLSIMVGGKLTDYEKVLPILEVYAKAVTLIGEVGSGQLCKMANQICIAGLLEGLAEALHFIDNANLDVDKVLSVISKGAAQSWQMDNRAQTMVNDDFEHGFAVDWMRKDLAIVLDEARTNGSRLPVTALVDQFYSEVQAMGGNRWDTSSLLKRLNTPNRHT